MSPTTWFSSPPANHEIVMTRSQRVIGVPALTASVIVPTFNRRDQLRRLIAGLDRCSVPGVRFEVIVTVDGSSDGSQEMLKTQRTRYPLRVLEQPNQGPAAARNRAIAAADGDVLLFLDDDVVPNEGLVEKHLELHSQDNGVVVIGPMIAPAERKMAPWLMWEAETLAKQYSAMLAGVFKPTPRQFYTANASVRREHVLAVGGFDTGFKRAEDVELAYRLAERGLRFHFAPAAAVRHEPDRTFKAWLRVGYEYGRHDVLMTYEGGHSHVLGLAYEEWNERHPLTRLLIRRCVGHPRRVRAAAALTRTLLAGLGPGSSLDQARRILCSALFNLQYWQGVADETGLGTQVLGKPEPPAPTDARPATSGAASSSPCG